MIAELYDKSNIVLALATAFCAITIYPVFGWAVTTGYVILGYSFVVTPVLDRFFNSSVVRFLYTGSFLFPGFTAILFPLLIVFTVLNALIYQYWSVSYDALAIQAAFYTSVILAVYAVFKSMYIRVREETIDAGLTEEIKIAHIADIHIGASLGKQRLNQVVKQIKDINPDYTVITGDIFDGSGWPQDDALESLSSLDSVYASLGNHDYYYGDGVEEQLKKYGVTVLRNEATANQYIRFVGVDDTEYPGQVPSEHIIDLDDDTKRYSVLLYHKPEEVDTFKESNHDLMLSGHTHNGQIYSVTLLLRLFYSYLQGLYKVDDKYLNVTSGAGTGGPMMRLGTYNEITIITLK